MTENGRIKRVLLFLAKTLGGGIFGWLMLFVFVGLFGKQLQDFFLLPGSYWTDNILLQVLTGLAFIILIGVLNRIRKSIKFFKGPLDNPEVKWKTLDGEIHTGISLGEVVEGNEIMLRVTKVLAGPFGSMNFAEPDLIPKRKTEPTGHNAADVIAELMTFTAKNRTKKLNGVHKA